MDEKEIVELVKEKEGAQKSDYESLEALTRNWPKDPDVVRNDPKYNPKFTLVDIIAADLREFKERRASRNSNKDEQGKELKQSNYLKKQKVDNDNESNSDEDESDSSGERESSDSDDGDIKAKKCKHIANNSGKRQRESDEDLSDSSIFEKYFV